MATAAWPDPAWSRAARRRAVKAARATVRDRLRLPPKLTLSEWADQFRYLSAEASAQPGPWRTDRVPYLREIMDTISGREYQDVTVVKCSQSAGSEALLNACGYYMDQEPSSILVIQPNVKPMAEAFSKSRIAPMVRDCPRLRGKVKDPRARDSGNTILQKAFPGGTLFIMGANSPAGLASNPIRVVLADELDRWEDSAGTEGDPLSLAEARQITYGHRKKRVKVSSPGNEGESRIEKEWKLSDQRHYYVPCPHCGTEQPLEWRDSGGKPDIRVAKGEPRLVWDKSGDGDERVHHPETAVYVCVNGCAIEGTHKPAMLAAGRWVKHNPSSNRAGFHVSGLLSPWVRWSDIAAKWLAVKDDDELRKPFFNTLLGLLYTQSGEEVDATKLSARRESWHADVPMGAAVLTMAIDVQGDRIEVEVRGWGAEEESWLIWFERLYGDPENSDVWERARAILDRAFRHESGVDLHVRSCAVDSGYLQDTVFSFVKSCAGGRVFATKGVDNAKQPLSKATRANRDGVRVFNFNPVAFKDTLFSRLKRVAPGKGYMHFGTQERTNVPDDFFEQYGNEKRRTEWRKNRPVVSYVNPNKKRNEAIDLYNNNLVALRALGASFVKRLGGMADELRAAGAARKAAQEVSGDAGTQTDDAPRDQSASDDAPPPRRRGGWMKPYR